MKTLILIVLACVLSGPSLAWAAAETLYVRPLAACTFNGDGTAYACAASGGAVGAFRGFANVLTNAVDETAGQVDPGDTLYICGSHVQQFTSAAAGVAGNKITISWNCPGDTGIIDGTGNNYGFYSVQPYLNLINPRVHDGNLQPMSLYTNTDETRVGFVTVTGGEVYNGTGSGLKCFEYRGEDMIIDGLYVHDCDSDGIWVKGKRGEIKNVRVANVSRTDLEGDGIQMTGLIDGSLIHDNTIDHTAVDSKYCILTTSTGGTETVRVYNNTCLKRSTDTVGIGIRSDVHTAYHYGNTITGGLYGLQCGDAATQTCYFYGNLIIAPNETGIRVGDGTPTAAVANNTIIGGTTCIQFDVNAATAYARNNICVGQVTGINKNVAGSAVLDDHNLFYKISGNNLLDNGTPTTPGTGSLLATNPLLLSTTYANATTGAPTGGARTLGNSPARRAGIVDSACGDLRLRPCWTPPDIGAYQASSGDPANTRTAR